jgi:hypothetical protein
MLLAFCAATIIFQNINLKNYYSTKAQKESMGQSFNGQLGLLEEESQTIPSDTLEDEVDDFTTESCFFVAQHCESITFQYFLIQEKLFDEHHPEITSPPPQA